ncbi:hypothetical protein M0813_19992 [Anaeramoeba flamelloides]|uniref:Serine aminopeptidase S33 domain-containing protein n=1 Tax=Anaeramoeba flamelloides TaxID=1746091 RepID=A0ABQ8YLU7_9EUKA|nr:hypothetical protein M0813_19992 [Anaeramoeba flamelloides]
MGPLLSKIVFRPPKRVTLKHQEKLSWVTTKNKLKVPILKFTPEDEYEEDFKLVNMGGITSTSESDSFCNRSWSISSTDESRLTKKKKTNGDKNGLKKNVFQLTETEEESWSEIVEEKKKNSKTNSVDQKLNTKAYKPIFVPKTEKEKVKLPFQTRKRMNIIFSHGNGESIYELDRFAIRFARKTNCNVYLFEYPGYPQAKGKAKESNCYQSAEAVYLWLVNERKVDPSKILWFGHSLGSAVAMETASNYRCAGVLLMSPLLSCFRVVLNLNVRLPYDIFVNVKKAPKVNVPVMVIHGTQDKVVPVEHGKKLYKLFPNQFDSVWLTNAGHNNIESRFRIRFYRETNRFIDFLISKNEKKTKIEKKKKMQREKEKEKLKEEVKDKEKKEKGKGKGKEKGINKYSNSRQKKSKSNKKKLVHSNSNYGLNFGLTSSSSLETVFDINFNVLKEKRRKKKKKENLQQNQKKLKKKNINKNQKQQRKSHKNNLKK